MPERAWIGTSGYAYDSWKGSFYPEKLPGAKMLASYAGHFPTVESNSTFRDLPDAAALARWVAETPPHFRFALKAWQRITHHRRLRGASDALADFCRAARRLGWKLGPILFQLPHNLKVDVPLLSDFLAELPAGIQAAFDFRHASWFHDAVFTSLAARGAALCISEDDELATPLVRTARFGYVRLRRARYAPAALATWAERIQSLAFPGPAYVFLMHDEDGRAPRYARQLTRRFSL